MAYEDDEELRQFATERSRKTRFVAWIALIAMLATGGGATIVALFVN